MSDYKELSTISEKDYASGVYLTLFQRKLLQKKLTSAISEQYRQRIQIMLLADGGKTQTEICQILGCCQATARHWMLMVRTQMAHKWQDQPLGRPKVINHEYVSRLQELVNKSPKELGYPFRRWTANWLSKHLAQEFDISISDRHINRLLEQMGLSTKGQSKKMEEKKSQTQGTANIKIGDLAWQNNSKSQELPFINLVKSEEG